MGHTQKCVNCPISKNKNKNLSSVFVIRSVLINKVLFKFIFTRVFSPPFFLSQDKKCRLTEKLEKRCMRF